MSGGRDHGRSMSLPGKCLCERGDLDKDLGSVWETNLGGMLSTCFDPRYLDVGQADRYQTSSTTTTTSSTTTTTLTFTFPPTTDEPAVVGATPKPSMSYQTPQAPPSSSLGGGAIGVTTTPPHTNIFGHAPVYSGGTTVPVTALFYDENLEYFQLQGSIRVQATPLGVKVRAFLITRKTKPPYTIFDLKDLGECDNVAHVRKIWCDFVLGETLMLSSRAVGLASGEEQLFVKAFEHDKTGGKHYSKNVGVL